jgi:hypothetical protein
MPSIEYTRVSIPDREGGRVAMRNPWKDRDEQSFDKADKVGPFGPKVKPAAKRVTLRTHRVGK